MIKTIIGLITIVSVCFGVYFYNENRYALSQELEKTKQELEKTKQRLDYKIIFDQVEAKQKRIWTIEDRYQSKEMPETVKEDYRQIQEDKKILEKKLGVLEKK